MTKRGSIVFAFLLILVLTVLGAAIFLRSVNENLVAQRTANSSAALWASEAGLQKVLWEYNYNSCQGMVQEGTSTACASCTGCGSGNKAVAGTLTGYGDYDVTLNNANTTIQSIGSIPNRDTASKIQRKVQATIGKPDVFSYGIFAQGQVDLSNNILVDSYNSNDGAYGGSNIHSNGNVGSNGTSPGIITISNNVVVNGNVSTGLDGTVTVDNNATVSGSTTHNNSVALPAVVVPSTLTALLSSGQLSLGDGASGTINAGDYKYNGISVSNNSSLTINGDVRLYLTDSDTLSTGNNATITIASGASLTVYTDGVITFANNISINTVSQLPSKFQIYSTYTGSDGVNLHNNGTSYVAIYAPQTDIDINNNGQFYGAIVGKTVDMNNNAQSHYDEALATLASPFENAILSNWQEY